MIREAQVSGRLSGRMRVPGSKSLTNRALVCAALAHGTSRLAGASASDDSALMANGLNQMGILVRRDGEALLVEGKGGALFAPKFPVPVGNAGTTLRFLLALGALAEGTTVLEGGGRMAERPNADIVEALASLGVRVDHEEGTARFAVTGGTLPGGDIAVRSDRSSQFLSALMMVAPRAARPLTLRAAGPLASGHYVRLTVDVMEAFGASVAPGPGDAYTVDAPRAYAPATYAVEPDASGATYPFAAAAIAGGSVAVPGTGPSSHQPDAAFAGVLESMGCTVAHGGGGTSVAREGPLRGIDVSMRLMPDAVPALLAVTLFAEGPSRIGDVGILRFKESNRMEGMAQELRKLGAAIDVTADAIAVRPVPLHGALLDPLGDHRLAMAFALVGLRVPGVRIEDAECVRKSFPTFWEALGEILTDPGTTHG